MIGIDTNILLRIFETEDDPAQSLRARKAIAPPAAVSVRAPKAAHVLPVQPVVPVVGLAAASSSAARRFASLR